MPYSTGSILASAHYTSLLSRMSNGGLFINAIGPVWDGNEVWLVTGGGALFAAFPEVYATAFSGFYLALILLLFALIFRAVAIEFRSKQPMHWWRQMWDVSFSVSSIVSSLLIGVALGNIALGIPLAGDHEFAGSFFGLLNPYASAGRHYDGRAVHDARCDLSGHENRRRSAQ